MVDIRIENHSSIAESQRERQRAAHVAFLLALPDAFPAFLARAVRCSGVSFAILALPPSEAFRRISSRSISSGVRRFAMPGILPQSGSRAA
jgi:hypothetical protein